MKESISYTFLLNIIITFIVISFFVIMCIMSYTKAFRVNSKVVNALEIAEVYNNVSKDEVKRIIRNYGYQQLNIKCPIKEGQEAVLTVDGYTKNGICVYKFINGNKYSYGVITFMTFDFPIVDKLIRIPVFGRSRQLHYMG